MDEQQKQEVIYQYGSEQAFRQKALGSIIISDKASVSLDSKWSEFSHNYPNLFPADTSSTDMPRVLMEAIGTLRDMKEVSNYANQELTLQQIQRNVYDSYWRTSNLRTVADVKQKQIDKLKAEHSKRMEQLKEKHRENVDRLNAEHAERIKAVKKEYTEKSKAKQQEIINRYKKSRQNAVESHQKTVTRGQTEKSPPE